MKKILVTATVPSMIGLFNMNNIHILQQLEYEVHVACNWNDTSIWTNKKTNELKQILINKSVKIYQISFSRNPLNLSDHLNSYSQLLDITKEHKYKFIHCHTPIAGAISRMVCKKTKTKCIYTAHGFHFYKGASLKKWILFYPVEKLLSKYTDILITINKEDYERAKRKFKSRCIKYVPGIGVNHKLIKEVHVDKELLKEKLQIPKKNSVILSIGELSKRKNHSIVIKALRNFPNITYLICGQGVMNEKLIKVAKKNNVDLRLLGFRDDIIDILKISDIFVFPSLQEGLPVALMEAMCCGIPCVVSNIRGNIDLISNLTDGLIVKKNSIIEYSKAIQFVLENSNDFDMNSIKHIDTVNKISCDEINKIMNDIYKSII